MNNNFDLFSIQKRQRIYGPENEIVDNSSQFNQQPQPSISYHFVDPNVASFPPMYYNVPPTPFWANSFVGLPPECPELSYSDVMRYAPNTSITTNPPMNQEAVRQDLTSTANAPLVSSRRFQLDQQPNEVQRKSYKNENRCLRPNPLMIRTRADDTAPLPKITSGVVDVKLVNGDGEDLPMALEQRLVCNEGGKLTKMLDDTMTASFALKLLCTSEGNRFRLAFTINYYTEDGTRHEEQVLSLPFVASSNRKKSQKDQAPFVLDMKPQHGSCHKDHEVWIKGKNFGERVQVTVGDKQCTILETFENLIVALIPARFDLTTDSSLPIIVSNRSKNGDFLSAENKLSFVYKVQSSKLESPVYSSVQKLQ